MISSSKLSWGGPRLNAGGPRANSGGPRANAGGFRPGAGAKRNPVVTAPTRPDADRWYCVHTAYHAELTADIAIRLAGFTLFMPTVWLPATLPRRDSTGAVRPGKPARIEPMFPRYLFARFHRGADDWQQIRRLPGVDGIFGTSPGRPTAVPDEAIQLIRGLSMPDGAYTANGCLYPANVVLRHHQPPVVRAVPLALGVTARLLNGPMADADLTGLCTWSDGKRVRLLFQIMGGAVSVNAAQAEIEVV